MSWATAAVRRGAPGRQTVIRGRVLHIRAVREPFNPGDPPWRLIELLTPRGDEIVVAGNMSEVFIGQELEVEGSYDVHQRYGGRFKASSVVEATPTKLADIQKFLELFEGVGPATARAIAARFGERTAEILDREPERLEEVDLPQFTQARRRAFLEDWKARSAAREIQRVFMGAGLGEAKARRLHLAFGAQAAAILSRNPYLAADQVEGIGFLTADRIAAALELAPDSPARVLAGLRHVMRENEGFAGNTWLAASHAMSQTVALLRHAVSPPRAGAALDELVKSGELLWRAGKVARAVTAETEAALAAIFAHLARSGQPAHARARREAARSSAAYARLTDEQRAAADALLGWSGGPGGRVAILTGGPGTGKTTTTKALLEVARLSGLKTLLAAPTGKAAKRMEAVCGHPARTIHRLLEYQRGGIDEDRLWASFRYGNGARLDCDLLVVDEASMIDVRLMRALVQALPDRARLVLIGDPDQLPSPGPGAVLRDIVKSRAAAAFALRSVHRQAEGSAIIAAAHAVRSGLMPSRGAEFGFSLVRRDKGSQMLEGEEPADFNRRVAGAVLDTVRRLVLEGARPSDVQVLTPQRTTEAGSRALNLLLRDLLNPDRGQPGLQVGERSFRAGDRVIQLRNNYEHDVFNGDQGTVAGVDLEDKRLAVDFGRARPVWLERSGLGDLDLAYAITVHKSQGSEFPHVVVALTRSHAMMLRRNLIYTAISRAKKTATMVGEIEALSLALGKQDEARVTFLAEMLREAAANAAPTPVGGAQA